MSDITVSADVPRLTCAPLHVFTHEDGLARISGSALGGALVVAFGASAALTIDAVSFLVSCVALGLTRAAHPPAPAPPRQSLLADIAQGVRQLYANRLLGAATGEPLQQESGYFVEPTILTNVGWGSALAQEEVFGPVLSIVRCDGYDEAMRISNSVKYGMSGTIFTQDPASMFQALTDFQAGMLHVNRPGVGAYAHLPHVGAKDSQLGPPECSSEVWNFYTDVRSACIRY